MNLAKIVHVCTFDILFFLLIVLVIFTIDVCCIGEIIYAVNAGGEAHTDIYGVHYKRDPLGVGTASDYGKSILVGRVPPADILLYQTERYHLTTFSYDVPIKDDGDYVLVLKFCEVYFTASNLKVLTLLSTGFLQF